MWRRGRVGQSLKFRLEPIVPGFGHSAACCCRHWSWVLDEGETIGMRVGGKNANLNHPRPKLQVTDELVFREMDSRIAAFHPHSGEEVMLYEGVFRSFQAGNDFLYTYRVRCTPSTPTHPHTLHTHTPTHPHTLHHTLGSLWLTVCGVTQIGGLGEKNMRPIAEHIHPSSLSLSIPAHPLSTLTGVGATRQT